MRETLLLTVAGAALFAAATARSQSTPFELGEVVVTGSRPLRPGVEAVLTREELDRLNLDRLSDALARVPGLTLTPGARGGPRNESRVFIRGFDGSQTVTSLDGVPFYVPYDGEPTDLARFTTFDLAAVEVSKGFGSALAGPNALGGTVNLVSRRPSGPASGEARTALDLDNDGSTAGGRASLQAGAARGRFYAQAGASLVERDHARLPKSFDRAGPRFLGGGGLSAGGLEDGRRRNRSESRDHQVNAKLGFTPGPGHEYAVLVWSQESERGVPPYAGPPVRGQTFNYFDWPKWDRRGAALAGDTALGPARLRLRAYVDQFENRLLGFDDDSYATQRLPLGRVFDSLYDDLSTGGSAVLTGPVWRGGELGAAVHVRRDEHKETPNVLPGRETPDYRFEDLTTSYGLELRQAAGPRVELILGAALQRREAEKAQDAQRGGASFPLGDAEATDAQAGLTWRLETGRIFAGVARKSRFATQFERYSYRFGQNLPNPQLEVERATHLQLGWAGRLPGGVSAEAALFRSELDDLIQRATVSPGVTQFRNVGKARNQGGELSLRGGPAGALSRWGVDYAYLERRSRSEPRTLLFGTPRHTLAAFADFDITERVRVTPAVLGASKRNTSDLEQGEPVDGFVRLDLKLSADLTDQITVEAVAANLTDELYEFDRGYPDEGRRLSIGLRARL